MFPKSERISDICVPTTYVYVAKHRVPHYVTYYTICLLSPVPFMRISNTPRVCREPDLNDGWYMYSLCVFKSGYVHIPYYTRHIQMETNRRGRQVYVHHE